MNHQHRHGGRDAADGSAVVLEGVDERHHAVAVGPEGQRGLGHRSLGGGRAAGEPSYLLRFDPGSPSLRGRGWTLCCWRGERCCWTLLLAAHGAGPDAPARVARAVAVRALAARGAHVVAWSPGPPDEPLTSLACTSPHPHDSAPPAQPLGRHRVRKRWAWLPALPRLPTVSSIRR